jgi:3-phosphoshikimate 1-carboxyvinyltransferase
MLNWLAGKGQALSGEIEVPGDKSVSHRSIMLGALAEGVTEIEGFLEGEDTIATSNIFQLLGVTIESDLKGFRRVHGVGLHGLKAPSKPLDCGNAGTGMRLMAGVLSAQAFESELIGDASLSKRPMNRVVEPLRLMGAHIETTEGGLPPLKFYPNKKLQGIEIKTKVASAQVKSALLLAGLYAEGDTVVHEPHPTRDYTESMLRQFGYSIDYSPGYAKLKGGGRLIAQKIRVPADFSSAAFFIVAASVIPGSDLLIKNVGIHPRRTGLLRALQLMGANIDVMHVTVDAADIRVRHAQLHGIDIPEHLVPDMIDEFPALFVAASLANGTTRVSGAAELRVKESDRIAVMADALKNLGAQIVETPDGAIIDGVEQLSGGVVDSHGDHRIAMSASIAAQRSEGQVVIKDCANVATSFPGYLELAQSVGFTVQVSGQVR